ncbi:hypothetical protein CCACVL1_14039 [Corchorus capsularis]|uniref:Uncharacterized protein n=1 Tax=Corchorus capsularis TaxID=210143 RepID=A0A1R3I8G6_COCAP|nr:hypothetical protein CCACVL1_14039 [Corchorus capsularis]
MELVCVLGAEVGRRRKINVAAVPRRQTSSQVGN